MNEIRKINSQKFELMEKIFECMTWNAFVKESQN